MQKLEIEIENKAGFCPGVVNAIEIAEASLKENERLYCLGDIVHNPAEVNRLQDKGLVVITREQFAGMRNEKVLLRSHGEPPETFQIAKENNIALIDATCKIVGNLQRKVGAAWKTIRKNKGSIVIFGKEHHPETIGLMGVTDGNALVVSSMDDLVKVDFSEPVRLFSQTTMDPATYQQIVEECSRQAVMFETDFEYQASVCGWMSSRVKNLRMFGIQNDLVIFVAGKESSNGKFLFSELKKANSNSYFISEAEEIDKNWFGDETKIGISGATSTPLWLLKDVRNSINKFYVSE